MESYWRKVREAGEFLARRAPSGPLAGVLTGTGLGDGGPSLDIRESIPYEEIPHFPRPTVQSHMGRMLLGKVGEKGVVVLQGRFHLYEGYSPRTVTFPIRVLQALGVKTLILSNASGGLTSRWSAGDIMILSDHINLTGENPLIGPNDDQWGPRFPDMSRVYDARLMALAWRAQEEAGLTPRKGVYAGLKGPSLETPAEVRFLQTIGAEAVGFSTVHEVIAAVHGGMRVLALSVVTNVHDPDDPRPADVDEIIAEARAAAPKLGGIIEKVIGEGVQYV
ncbi:MAG: purine-nucleoside phosphorylase [Desulfobacterales bacterium]|nr:purine-nucleoside phosphorylase [Desulfobacterales bacterium]